ncbi:mobile mystery protein A [Candidatus Neomarinimicrobiota bacterium]
MLDQMDNKLSKFKKLSDIRCPPKGWVRAIRVALGMNGRQLATRLGMSIPGVSALETNEANGKVTLNTLRRAAEALDCTLVYGFAPRTTLREMVHKQTLKIARTQVGYVSHTMQLEDQLPSKKTLEKEIKRVTDDLMNNWPRTLWDE